LRLHPRTQLVAKAKNELESTFLDFLELHPELTYTEICLMLNYLSERCLTYNLRHERHPGQPDKKADEA
jgi:hypothetical protein